MTDRSISGNDEKKFGKTTSFSKILGSPFRSSKSNLSKSDKSSSSSSNLFARLNPVKIFRNSNSGKRMSESARGVKDAEEQEADNFLPIVDLIHPITEKIKDEEPTKPANTQVSSPETIDKKEILATKPVEKKAEVSKEVVKPKTKETVETQKTEETPEKKNINDVSATVQQQYRSLGFHLGKHHDGDDQKSAKLVDHHGTEKEKSKDTNQSDATLPVDDLDRDREETHEEKRQEQSCVCTLAQGLHSFCAPKND